MKNCYKLFYSFLIAAGAAMGMQAENPVIGSLPPEGAIDSQIYPEGLISVELTVEGSINRESTGFVTLERNGEAVRSIPASNVPMFYCIDGFERSSYGNIHIDFWTTTAGKNGSVPGDYTVKFDEGVVFFGHSNVPNDAFTLCYTIADTGMTLDPVDGATLDKIDKIDITFPVGASVSYVGGANGITLENIRSSVGAVHPEVEISGNTATLSFSPALTDEGNYILDFVEGAFKWTAGGVEYSNPVFYASYNVVDTSDQPEISPAPGQYTKFDGIVKNGEASSSFFTLYMPEGLTVNFTSMGSTYMYPVKEDGTLDTSVKSYRFKAVSDPDNKSIVYLNSVNAQTVLSPLPGEYMLAVGSNSYMTSDGKYNKDYLYGPYEIVASGERNFTVTPSDTESVEKLSEVKIAFPEGSDLTWNGGNYVSVSNGVTVYQIYPGIDENVLSVNIFPVVEEAGEWTIDIAQNALSVDGQGNPVRVTYTVDPAATEDNGVKYDIEMTAFTPRTSASDKTVDIANKTFDPVTMTFNMDGLRPVEGAKVSLSGPGYSQSAAIVYAYGGNEGKNSTVMKATLNDPVYNGTYTLTIEKGSIGDAEYIADHNIGHANAEVVYEFELVGGKDVSEMKVDTSLEMTPSLASSSEVASLKDLTIEFNEEVFFNEDTELNVTWMEDLSAMGYKLYGKASLSRVSETVVRVTMDPLPQAAETIAEYCLNIPEGTFWNKEHELDANVGKVNAKTIYKWLLWSEPEFVEVVAHTPATDAEVEGFATGEGITIRTTNDAQVAAMEISLVQYELGNDFDAGTVILDNVMCTSKTEDGAICWINEGENIQLGSEYWYEVSFTLYDENDSYIGDGVFEFYGAYDVSTSVGSMVSDVKAAVYNMQGIRVAESTDNLAKGIYVVDGKKFVVR